MFTTAQNQLRFDPNQRYWGYLSINPHAPPYVPNIQPPLPQMGQWMPLICGTLAARIQQAADENALRRTVFNMAGENQFGNAYFDAMSTMAIELATYIMVQERAAPDVAVDKATELVHDYFTAANVREYRVLEQYLGDPNMRNAIQGTIQNFDNTANILKNFMNQLRGQHGGGYQQAQNSHFNGSAQSHGYAPVTSYADGQSGGGNNSFTGGSSIFEPIAGKTSNTPAPAAQPASATYSQWNNAPDNAQQAVAAAVQAPLEESAVPSVAALPSNWVPNLSTEAYFYAYDPQVWNASLLVMSNGTTLPDYTLKTQEEQMDFNRHATPNVFGNVPDFLDVTQAAKTMQNIHAGVKRLNDEVLEEPQEGDVTTIKTMVAPDWLFATSEADAWMRAGLTRLQIEPGSDGMPDVYRVYARVAEAVVGNSDESDTIRALVKTKTLLGLREKMTSLGGEMSTALYNTVNLRMTDMVNRKVLHELGLKKVEIGNFHDDIGELIEYLKNKFGDLVKTAFLRTQESDIAKTLQVLGADVAQAESDIILRDLKFPETQKPAITFVASNYSLTYLDCLSWELGIVVSDEIPVKLSYELTPLFYDLVKGSFLDADRHETEDVKSLAIARVLMRTKDGRVFECTRGALADESYLITLVK